MPPAGYSMLEKKKIINFIVERDGYSEIKGRKLWMELANSGITHRTWQSLKEVFIKRILPDINNPYYHLSHNEVLRFKNGSNSGQNTIDWIKKQSPEPKPSTSTNGRHIAQNGITIKSSDTSQNSDDDKITKKLRTRKTNKNLNFKNMTSTPDTVHSEYVPSLNFQSEMKKDESDLDSSSDVCSIDPEEFKKAPRNKTLVLLSSKSSSKSDDGESDHVQADIIDTTFIDDNKIDVPKNKVEARKPNDKRINETHRQKVSENIFSFSAGRTYFTTRKYKEPIIHSEKLRTYSSDESDNNDPLYEHRTSTESVLPSNESIRFNPNSSGSEESLQTYGKNSKQPLFAIYEGQMYPIYSGNPKKSKHFSRSYYDNEYSKYARNNLSQNRQPYKIKQRAHSSFEFCCSNLERLYYNHLSRYVDEGSLGPKPNPLDYMKIQNSSSYFKHAPTCGNPHNRLKMLPIMNAKYPSQRPSRIQDFTNDEMKMRYYNDLENYNNNGRIGHKPLKESYQRSLTNNETENPKEYNDFYKGSMPRNKMTSVYDNNNKIKNLHIQTNITKKTSNQIRASGTFLGSNRSSEHWKTKYYTEKTKYDLLRRMILAGCDQNSLFKALTMDENGTPTKELLTIDISNDRTVKKKDISPVIVHADIHNSPNQPTSFKVRDSKTSTSNNVNTNPECEIKDSETATTSKVYPIHTSRIEDIEHEIFDTIRNENNPEEILNMDRHVFSTIELQMILENSDTAVTPAKADESSAINTLKLSSFSNKKNPRRVKSANTHKMILNEMEDLKFQNSSPKKLSAENNNNNNNTPTMPSETKEESHSPKAKRMRRKKELDNLAIDCVESIFKTSQDKRRSVTKSVDDLKTIFSVKKDVSDPIQLIEDTPTVADEHSFFANSKFKLPDKEDDEILVVSDVKAQTSISKKKSRRSQTDKHADEKPENGSKRLTSTPKKNKNDEMADNVQFGANRVSSKLFDLFSQPVPYDMDQGTSFKNFKGVKNDGDNTKKCKSRHGSETSSGSSRDTLLLNWETLKTNTNNQSCNTKSSESDDTVILETIEKKNMPISEIVDLDDGSSLDDIVNESLINISKNDTNNSKKKPKITNITDSSIPSVDYKVFKDIMSEESWSL